MAAPLSDYAAVKDYLYGLKAGGMKFGIDRMQRLAVTLGHPERSYPVIHVAGTNGKGSVSAMIESVLRTAGLRTGLYTSPHLVKLGERVQVNRRLLTEEEIVAYARELRPVAEQAAAYAPDEHATFFEFMSAMAFLQFQRRRVDVAVVETGMGGRLDATNIVQPEVSVITSIGLDHCVELGDTVEKIAREKAGIIKPGRPVVIGRMPAGAEEVIREVAAAQAAPVHSVRGVFGEDLTEYPVSNLEGDYQRWNAATAVLAMRLLPANLRHDGAAITRGLQHVDWPGRWQRLEIGGRHLILDASHNPEGAQELDKNLTKLVSETGRKPVIIAGALGEFRARSLLEVVTRHACELHVVTPNQARATPYEEMAALVPVSARHLLRRGDIGAIFPDSRSCTLGHPADTVVVTGSIYLLGEVLEQLDPGRGSREDKLQDF
ncbi:MAG: dihydrofolate synthase / folylpolyglutamate synthase [Verrucomicrobiota bacterium]|nr:dihydrofolate synthase / folylpolyglutamate synthase [Verrucomicrobiota bacterium]